MMADKHRQLLRSTIQVRPYTFFLPVNESEMNIARRDGGERNWTEPLGNA